MNINGVKLVEPYDVGMSYCVTKKNHKIFQEKLNKPNKIVYT